MSIMTARIAFVYILVCKDGTFYTGFTTDLLHRLKVHNKKQGARYTRSRIPVYLVYHEVFFSEREARQREYAIKQLSRKQKLELISSQNACLLSLQNLFANWETESYEAFSK